MKPKHFKITDTTLFVYKPQKNQKNEAGTDPTTNMYTMTVTGIINAGRSK